MTEWQHKAQADLGHYKPRLEKVLLGLALVSLLTMNLFTNWSNPGGVDGGFSVWFAVTAGMGGLSLVRVFQRSDESQSPTGRTLASFAAVAYAWLLGLALSWYIPVAATGNG